MNTAQHSGMHLEKPISSGYASVNDTQVYYQIYGEGRPIILLHGAFMTIETNWGELISELSKTRKVIALELQGHGRTPFSDRPLSRATLASDIEGVMDYLNIDRADVAGYSFGGSVAYQFAVQYPERLRKLAIISSAYKTEGWAPETNAAFKAMKPEFFSNTPMQTAYKAVAPDKTKWIPFLEKMIALAGEPYNTGDENIANITSPILLIAGDNDGLNKIELIKTYESIAGATNPDPGVMPESQLAILPGQGHVSLMYQTQTIFSYLDSFLG
ncbi:pimeloyl-ACP methyl ester carboxylesterase [Arcticibacter pallidicorallinus]|uniref:Pimeloyl-ACP methyl ester carboxylesterase n=1 Tax=Arcticibacter pallidicorallinus TaxID=1259464 RepID=A0A2T0TSZ9_9SPHI|nr:alpha/beta hydrolase [Arcticibacter pallidicorallinus]PRY48836.1 pimeloyl-ACP methyl ester carboxylesterase [Arcticibacter pallidicorallinus]